MSDLGLIQSILDLVIERHDGLGVVVLFGSSLVEYVFPPFPGDVVTLFGTFLVVQGYWSFAFALCLVTLGSLLGAALDYGIGVWLGRRLDRLPRQCEVKRWTPLTREKFELLNQRFRRHGAVYILINRFLPGIRAFFFVVAGASRMPFGQVLLYAGISAVAWNTAILGVGYAVGSNWERLRGWFASYTLVVWCLLAAAAGIGLILWLRSRRRSRNGT